MNRIVFAAQLLGALIFCIAASAIADPGGQGQIKRVIKSSGDEPGTLKGFVKWDGVVLKAHAIRPTGERVLREGAAPAGPTKAQIQIDLDWAANFRSPNLNVINRALRGDQRAQSAELTLGARSVSFQNALITEVGFPALDGASKEPAYISISMAGEVPPPSGAGTPTRLSRSTPSAPESAEKTWLPANFRITIGGMNTSHVSRVSPIIVKPGAQAPKGGQRRSGETTLGDFVLSAADFKAANLVKWEGPELDASTAKIRPRPGRVIYGDANGRVLGVLKFRLVGLGKIKPLSGGNVQVGVRLDDFELSEN